ncbi:DMT family transporter [Ferrimonas senticii]|uniref:DMT family transporter n=1 Tax=Ferrimonas senticii TaxID=394566 RepID=UPI0003FE8725|nr:EamA family transporter [Ferrimonas senticii]
MSATTRAHLYLLLYAVLISSSFPLANYLGQSYPPLLTTLLRYLLAALGFIVLLAVRGQLRPISCSDFGRYLLISAPMVGYFLLMFVAGSSSSAVAMSALSTSIALFSLLFAWLGWRQPMAPRRLLMLLLGVAGALWIISGGNPLALGQQSWPIGNSVFVLACALMGLNPLVIRHWHRGEPMLQLTAWSIIAGTLLLAIGTLLWQPPLSWPDHNQWLAIGYLATISTMVTFFLFQSASLVVGGSSANAYGLLAPALVFIINGVIGIGWPQWQQAIGLIPILLTLIWLLRDDQNAG